MTIEHVYAVLMFAGTVGAAWFIWKYLSKWNLHDHLGSYHVRQCPSCHERLAKPIHSIDICEHCSDLLSARKIAIVAVVSTIAVALTIGVSIGVSTQAIWGVLSGLAATALLFPMNYLVSKFVRADSITSYLEACEAMRFIWSQTEDYNLDLRDAVRLRVHTKVRSMLTATFPSGSRVEYQNNIYIVREINEALCCILECGRDRIELPCGRLRHMKALIETEQATPTVN